jgi:glycosyltransferase 2 family protein
MLGSLRRAIAVLRERQILRKLGIVISITIIVAACYILSRILKDLDLDGLVAAIRGTDRRSIVLAAICVAAGYFTLTFYDLFALRTIGKADVPYRIAALAGFTSYSIGHNVGASVFTGGAVRYRIYSGWGLNAVDVAKVCFIAGLTFWLGNAAVLGIGVLYHPEAAASFDKLPPMLNRVLALIILAALVRYVMWVWIKPRQVGRGTWTVVLPGGPLTLLQIAIGIIDLGFCALAMFILLPNEPHVGFVVVAVIFVSATLLGFASHSPGGLGVFDAAMLVGLWQFRTEELLAGMLLFRALYYLLPFVLSVALLTFREVIVGARNKRVREALASLDEKAQQRRPIVQDLGDGSI